MDASEPGRTAVRAPGADWWGVGPMLILLVAAGSIAVAGLASYSSIIVPVFFAFSLALTVRPAVRWLTRRGLPLGLATFLVLLGLYAVIGTMVAVIGYSIQQLTQLLPQYRGSFGELYARVLDWLVGLGIKREDITSLTDKIDYTSLIGYAQTILGQFTSLTSLVLTVLLALAFLILDTSQISQRVARLRLAQPHLTDALADFAHRVRRYWVVSAVFGLALALGDYVALLIIGVPLSLTWAVLAFFCNFIPTIGFFLALIPPALIALLDGGPSAMLWTIGAYMVINFITQSLILPKFLGDAVGLNVTATFVSLLFWTLVLGPFGALLAVPLTLFVRAVLIQSTPGLQWLDVFIGAESGETATPTPGVPRAPRFHEGGS